MKKMTEMDAHDRPREKIAKSGPEKLSDRELVAAILGRGIPGRDVNVIAKDVAGVIKEKGTGIAFSDLISISGVGETKACQIVAAFELGRRHLTDEIHRIERPEDVLPLVEDLKGRQQEYFICITLNGAGEVIKRRTITKGLLNHSPVHPREVFAPAIEDRAASVILVHNHPSGSPEPSRQDETITKQIAEAGAILGISVLDHVIVAKRGFVSLKERGVL